MHLFQPTSYHPAVISVLLISVGSWGNGHPTAPLLLTTGVDEGDKLTAAVSCEGLVAVSTCASSAQLAVGNGWELPVNLRQTFKALPSHTRTSCAYSTYSCITRKIYAVHLFSMNSLRSREPTMSRYRLTAELTTGAD